MKLARLLVFSVGTLLMAVGYAVSQMRFFSGTTGEYIAQLDASPVPMLSLVLLVAAVILALVPDEGSEDSA